VNDASLLYKNTGGVGCANINCGFCSLKDNSICLECAAGKYLSNNNCWATCPVTTSIALDSADDPLLVCEACHHSCKTCVGTKANQCSECCDSGACGPLLDRDPLAGTCTCPAGKVESNGLCLDRCDNGLTGRMNAECYAQCPSHSLPFYDFNGLAAQDFSHYDTINTC